MLKLLRLYIKFWWRSKNEHGVHSPFVYDLVTQCFYDKTKYSQYQKIKEYRKKLRSNTNVIEVTDLGVGSHIMRQNKRVISDIAKNAGSTLSRSKLLFRLVNFYKPKRIIELGTSLGIATHAMSLGQPDAEIITIEGCPNIADFSSKNLKAHGVKNIEIINAEFSKALADLSEQTFDLIYIDGNHQKDATISYFETLMKMTHNNTIIVFDDIYWSKGMMDAWETIIKNPKITVSIDTFFWGIVFLRTEQAKEHFVVRI